MRSRLKLLLNLICRIVVSPCAMLCRIENHFSGDSATIFDFWAHLFALLPGLPGNFLRRAFYSLTLQQCSLNCHIGFGTFFSHRDTIIEDDVYIGPYSIIGTARIGKGSLLGSRVSLLSGKKQHIKDADGNWAPADFSRFEQINIAANVWVGEGAIIMADVGEGSLVAAGAVITHPMEPNVVVAGNPAKVVRPA